MYHKHTALANNTYNLVGVFVANYPHVVENHAAQRTEDEEAEEAPTIDRRFSGHELKRRLYFRDL